MIPSSFPAEVPAKAGGEPPPPLPPGRQMVKVTNPRSVCRLRHTKATSSPTRDCGAALLPYLRTVPWSHALSRGSGKSFSKGAPRCSLLDRPRDYSHDRKGMDYSL